MKLGSPATVGLEESVGMINSPEGGFVCTVEGGSHRIKPGMIKLVMMIIKILIVNGYLLKNPALLLELFLMIFNPFYYIRNSPFSN